MRTFRRLNLADIYLGFEDLFTKRIGALTSTKAGAGQVEVLAAQRSEVSALPLAMTGRAFVDELSVMDDEHDGFGYALWYLTEAYVRAPRTKPETVAAARRVREAFIPDTTVLQSSYADEAARAGTHKGKIAEYADDLKMLPIDGGTAYDWALGFIAAGEKLSELLSKRADIEGQSRQNAQALRSETVGMLNDLRRAIAREKKKGGGTLPDDIDTQIFGYFDTLEENRAHAARAGKEKTETVQASSGVVEGAAEGAGSK